MDSLPSTLLENLRPRVLAVRKLRDEGFAIDELLYDIERRIQLLSKVEQQTAEANAYRLSVRLETALQRLASLREKLQHRMSELEMSANRLKSELADESLAYLSAAHSIRLGDVLTLPTGVSVRLEGAVFDEDYEPPTAVLVGRRLRKDGELGAERRRRSPVYDAHETKEAPQ